MGQSVSVTQSTNAVLMVRPHGFYPNPETAADNAFQGTVQAENREETSRRARGGV